jgi:hypothetical protein
MGFHLRRYESGFRAPTPPPENRTRTKTKKKNHIETWNVMVPERETRE